MEDERGDEGVFLCTSLAFAMRNLASIPKLAPAGVFLCTTSDVEMLELSSLLKLPEDVPVPDCNIKVLTMGFSSDFCHVAVWAQPSDCGMIPM